MADSMAKKADHHQLSAPICKANTLWYFTCRRQALLFCHGFYRSWGIILLGSDDCEVLAACGHQFLIVFRHGCHGIKGK